MKLSCVFPLFAFCYACNYIYIFNEHVVVFFKIFHQLKSQKGDATSASQNQSVGPVAAPVSVPVDIPEMDHAEDTVKERSRSITEQLIQVSCINLFSVKITFI